MEEKKFKIDGSDYEFTVHFKIDDHDNVIHAITKMSCLDVLEACVNTMKRAYPNIDKIEVVSFTFNHKDYGSQKDSPKG